MLVYNNNIMRYVIIIDLQPQSLLCLRNALYRWCEATLVCKQAAVMIWRESNMAELIYNVEFSLNVRESNLY